MTRQPKFKMTLDVGPLTDKDAIHHAIADRSIAAGTMMADDTILFRTQCFDRTLRSKVEIVSPQTHHFASEGFKGMSHQQ